jgi:uncharacterized protein (TIGR04255 family)
MARPAHLPDFAAPPVVEVALSVMFESIPLDSAHIGVLWRDHFASDFPSTADLPVLDSPIERERERSPLQPSPELQVMAPRLRTWFLNPAGTQLVQVQHDRLAHNWRKGDTGEDYPHWEAPRMSFERELAIFERFVHEHKVGPVLVRQCEVTYVNHIVAGQGWNSHADVARVFSVWQTSPSKGFLPTMEDGRFLLRYAMRDQDGRFLGRLHASVQPVFRSSDGEETPLFLMNMTARGAPDTPDIAGAIRFLDLGREWIVQGFTEMTTPEMHVVWGRR